MDSEVCETDSWRVELMVVQLDFEKDGLMVLQREHLAVDQSDKQNLVVMDKYLVDL